eukprot:4413166-Prymnesium_polylepis.2
MEEPSFFFKMSKFQEKLLAHLREHPEFVQPDARRNEVIERLGVPLQVPATLGVGGRAKVGRMG